MKYTVRLRRRAIGGKPSAWQKRTALRMSRVDNVMALKPSITGSVPAAGKFIDWCALYQCHCQPG
jgi:hypothetical protein